MLTSRIRVVGYRSGLSPSSHNLSLVSPRKRRRKATADPLDAYRRIRKPMPPPERVIPDKRRKVEEREAERELREEDPGRGDEAS
jgi:hypothetical protein